MNVLSLCDGISCLRIALQRGGHKVDKYFASEIKKSAIKCSKDNWNDIIQVGDITKLHFKDGYLYNIIPIILRTFNCTLFNFRSKILVYFMPPPL